MNLLVAVLTFFKTGFSAAKLTFRHNDKYTIITVAITPGIVPLFIRGSLDNFDRYDGTSNTARYLPWTHRTPSTSPKD